MSGLENTVNQPTLLIEYLWITRIETARIHNRKFSSIKRKPIKRGCFTFSNLIILNARILVYLFKLV